MWRTLYSLLAWCALPPALLRLLWRSRRDPDYRRRIGERLGVYRCEPVPGCVWIHAVSVGELQAALRLVETLRARDPRLPLLLTTVTPAASRLLRRRLGASVHHVYAPWDVSPAVRALLAHFRPRLLLLLETELWPNWLAACAARGIPAALVNARMSQRSAHRYARMQPLLQPMLAALALVAARGEDDAARLRGLGLPGERVVVCGDLKFDCAPGEQERQGVAALREALGAAPAWVAASVHAGEEAAVLAAHRALCVRFPRALLLLAPRHLERVPALISGAQAAGLTCAAWDGSASPPAGRQLLVLDSIGELARLCGLGDFAFIGGTLVGRGGHNPLEAAHWGLPLLSGDSWFNHAQIAAELSLAGALQIVPDGTALVGAVRGLADDAGLRTRRGAAALAVARAQPRASLALAQRLAPLL